MKIRLLHQCDLSERLLYSAFLLLMGLGYLMALAYLYSGHQMLDGKPGLSVEDVAFSYYGNRSGTRLEAAIRGPMAGFLDNTSRHHLVAWLQSGAGRDDYAAIVAPIIEKNCISCHGDAVHGMGVIDLSTYAALQVVADVDTGVSILSLMRVSHIHLFGIGLILIAVGMVFRRTQLNETFKSVLILLPFIAVFVDIAAWFLTKWDPVYAYTVVISGAVLGAALAAQIVISLYQLWWRGLK